MLPELSGVEVCRILRAESAVPIIMLTAKDGEVDKVVGPGARRRRLRHEAVQPAGADRADPRDPPADRAGRAQPSARPSSQVGRVQVDLAGHRILRDGAGRAAQAEGVRAARVPVGHPGQVFTRDQLLERVWGYDYAGETRTVDVHVHWLRAEIEADPGEPALLQTVRGVGYVLRRD